MFIGLLVTQKQDLKWSGLIVLGHSSMMCESRINPAHLCQRNLLSPQQKLGPVSFFCGSDGVIYSELSVHRSMQALSATRVLSRSHRYVWLSPTPITKWSVGVFCSFHAFWDIFWCIFRNLPDSIKPPFTTWHWVMLLLFFFNGMFMSQYPQQNASSGFDNPVIVRDQWLQNSWCTLQMCGGLNLRSHQHQKPSQLVL